MHLAIYCFHVFTKQCAKIKLPYDFRYVYYGFTNDNIQWIQIFMILMKSVHHEINIYSWK